MLLRRSDEGCRRPTDVLCPNNVNLAIKRADVVRDGDFLTLDAGEVTQVRTPTESATRKAQHVHLEELGMAAILTIRDVGAVSRAELAQTVARVFGWSRTGLHVDQRVNEAIDLIVSDRKATISDDAGGSGDRLGRAQ